MIQLPFGKKSRPASSTIAYLVRLEDRITPTMQSVTSVIAMPSTVNVGDTVSLSAVVADPNPGLFSYSPSGEVTFFFGDTNIGTFSLDPSIDSDTSAVAHTTVPTNTFGAGVFTVSAKYSGEPGFFLDGYDPSSGNTTVTIKAPTAPFLQTITSVSANPTSVAIGSNVVLTATVNAVPPATDSPTGQVQFQLGDTKVGTAILTPGANGASTASITVSTDTFGIGKFLCTATYLADPGRPIMYQGSDGSVTVTLLSSVPPQVPPPPPVARPLPPQPALPPLPVAGSGIRLTAVGTDVGAPGIVTVYNADGSKRFDITPFFNDGASNSPSAVPFSGGVRVAVADINGDGVPDIAVVPGPGRPVQVRVFSGTDGSPLWSQDVFESSFTGGGFVSAGDLNGDGKADVVVSPDEFGGPRVRVFSGANQSVLSDYFGIDDPNFRGGARTAVGDFNADGRDDLAVVAGIGGGPRVALFDGKSMPSSQPDHLTGDFFVFEQSLRNGVYVAAGNVSGGIGDDLIVGGGPGGGPRVMALRGKSLVVGNVNDVVANFFAGDPSSRSGVRVAVGDPDGNGVGNILAGAGPGGRATATAYLNDGTVLQDFPGTLGGVFVDGSESNVQALGVSNSTRPLSDIAITGRFIPGASTRVVFSDQNGFRTEVPATDVTADLVRVGLPVYRNSATGLPASGNLTAAVIQTPAGGNDIYSGTFTQKIDDLPTSVLTPGSYTRAILSQERDLITLGETGAEQIQYYSDGDVAADELVGGIDPAVEELNRRIAQIDDVLAGGDGSAGYGDASGGGLTLQDLAEMDRLLAAATGSSDLTQPDAPDLYANNWLDAGNVSDAVADYARQSAVVQSIVGYPTPTPRTAFAGLGNAVFSARPVAQMVQTATAQLSAGDISPAEAARLLAPQYLNQYRTNAGQTGQVITPGQNTSNNPFAGLADRVNQYVNGPTKSVVGWDGQRQTNPTSQRGTLYRNWTASKVYVDYKLTFSVSLSPGSVKVVVSGRVNSLTPTGYGSGATETSTDGTQVGSTVEGSWQTYDIAKDRPVSQRSIRFTASLRDDGKLEASIDGEPVLMSPM